MKTAYSYIRFSSSAQADGDSIRRQTAAAEAWCKHHGFTLDTTAALEDRGTSAYRGKHRAASSVLATFLGEVTAGRIPAGAHLIIENLDRLSRENPWDAVPLLCSIVNAGVSVVTLSPTEMVYQRGRDMTPLILAVVEFGRGHSESAVKAERVAEAWSEKKRQARETGAILTRRLPAWIEERGGALALIPDRARLVRRIFTLANRGWGSWAIVKVLTAEGIETWGRSRLWSKTYIHKILTRRVAVGEYQPIHDGRPDGPPIAGYYPAVVTEDVWQQAQAAIARRKNRPGKLGVKVASLFSGLLIDAVSQSRMLIAWQTRGPAGPGRYRHRVLVSADSLEGRCRSVAFPADVFEAAVLSKLREITPADILDEAEESESLSLAAEVVSLDSRLGQIQAAMAGAGDVQTLIAAARTLEAKIKAAKARLAEAEAKEASPVAGAWAEARTLLAAAQSLPARLRLRDLLGRIITKVYVAVVPRKKTCRIAAVQIEFISGARRGYVIRYLSAGRGRTSRQDVISSDKVSAVDFADRKSVAEIVTVLQTIPIPGTATA